MKTSTKQTIKEVFIDLLDETMAKLLHIQHQLRLPEKHRVIDFTKEELEEAQENLEFNVQEYQNILDDLES